MNRPNKLIEISVVIHPSPEGKRIWQHPVHDKMIVRDFTGESFEECVRKIFDFMDRTKFEHPLATLIDCDICSRRYSTYVDQIKQVKDLVHVRFPNAGVIASDNVSGSNAYD